MTAGNTTRFAAKQRHEVIAEVNDGEFDLVVVGGGINGAGVAHDAALRGLKVLLLEQRDLAFGTSSRSSKLIHGGLRYLEHYQFKLVFESTNERAALRKVAPHLVRPLKFALPVYESSRHPLWKMDLGLWLYDGLSLFKTEKRHVTIRTAKRMLEQEPLLNGEGLSGGLIYYDCITDDARLTLENAMAADIAGARVLTHAKVIGVDNLHGREGHAVVKYRDELSQREYSVSARGVVNCTGAWTDKVRQAANLEGRVVRPSKGVHIVVRKDRLPVNHAVALLAPQDGRVYFVIPWNDRTVIGTTDTDDMSDPSKLKIELADVDYLLEAANSSFPSAHLNRDDVFSGWVGLRPLIHVETENASDVPREHQIYKDGKMVTVAGGKLTTYRKMAAEIVDEATSVIHANCNDSTTETAMLPGGIGLGKQLDEEAEQLVSEAGITKEAAERLVENYGVHSRRVLAYGKRDPKLFSPLSPDCTVMMAEVYHAMEHELGCTMDDILVRRTSLSLIAEDQGLGAAEEVAEHMARELSWSKERKQRELDAFSESVDLTRAFRHEIPSERDTA
ncbi:MAG: glycerol-3-phosphate dehydrogenase [Myxococcota bacterium]|nr:glycerol-3-phosphate dehydrogenase [Myxococcota bacterium]